MINKQMLSVYDVPGVVRGSWGTVVDKTHTHTPAFMELHVHKSIKNFPG